MFFFSKFPKRIFPLPAIVQTRSVSVDNDFFFRLVSVVVFIRIRHANAACSFIFFGRHRNEEKNRERIVSAAIYLESCFSVRNFFIFFALLILSRFRSNLRVCRCRCRWRYCLALSFVSVLMCLRVCVCMCVCALASLRSHIFAQFRRLFYSHVYTTAIAIPSGSNWWYNFLSSTCTERTTSYLIVIQFGSFFFNFISRCFAFYRFYNSFFFSVFTLIPFIERDEKCSVHNEQCRNCV